jgi:hypothetical protein
VLGDFVLDWVVSWGDSLDIPWLVVQLAVSLQVEDGDGVNEASQQTQNGDNGALIIFGVEGSLVLDAGVLDEEGSVGALALSGDSYVWLEEVVNINSCNRWSLVSASNLLIDIYVVNESTALDIATNSTFSGDIAVVVGEQGFLVDSVGIGSPEITERALKGNLDVVSKISSSERSERALGWGVTHVPEGELGELLLDSRLDAVVLLEEEEGWHHDDGKDREHDDHGREEVSVSDHSESQNKIWILSLLFLWNGSTRINLLMVGGVMLLGMLRVCEERFLVLNCLLLGAALSYWFEEGEYSVQRISWKGIALCNNLLGC